HHCTTTVQKKPLDKKKPPCSNPCNRADGLIGRGVVRRAVRPTFRNAGRRLTSEHQTASHRPQSRKRAPRKRKRGGEGRKTRAASGPEMSKSSHPRADGPAP